MSLAQFLDYVIDHYEIHELHLRTKQTVILIIVKSCGINPFESFFG